MACESQGITLKVAAPASAGAAKLMDGFANAVDDFVEFVS